MAQSFKNLSNIYLNSYIQILELFVFILYSIHFTPLKVELDYIVIFISNAPFFGMVECQGERAITFTAVTLSLYLRAAQGQKANWTDGSGYLAPRPLTFCSVFFLGECLTVSPQSHLNPNSVLII